MKNIENPKAQRLRAAREAAGYPSAKAASERMGIPYPTYAGHENGSRGYYEEEASQYGRTFHVRPEWLLLGDIAGAMSQVPAQGLPPLAPIVDAITRSLDGLTEQEQRSLLVAARQQRALLRPEES